MVAFFPKREVFLQLGGFEIHWYGLLYLVAFYLAWFLWPRLQRYRELRLSRDDWLVILTAAVAGVTVGGRLGYVLFYEPHYFLQHPREILALWQGGMSAHGGFVGVAVGVALAAKKMKIEVLQLADVVVVPVALGLALGRVGNWINGELYVSNLAHAAAVMKNLFIAGVTWWVLKGSARRPGFVFGVFLALYATLRFVSEYWREQPWGSIAGLTRGQILSLPILLIGVWLLIWLRRRFARD